MSKAGGVPDAWDDDWVNVADVGDSISLVGRNSHTNLSLRSRKQRQNLNNQSKSPALNEEPCTKKPTSSYGKPQNNRSNSTF